MVHAKSAMAIALAGLFSAGVLHAGGFYAGAGLGFNNSDLSGGNVDRALGNAGITSATSVDDGNLTGQIFAGYRHNENVAAELGWVNLGDVDTATRITAPTTGNASGTLEADGFRLGVVAGANVNENINLFSNLGAFWWNADYDVGARVNGLAGNASLDDDGVDVYFGLGAGYRVSDQFSLRGEWNRYSLGGDTNTDYDVFSLSGMYHF